MVYGLTASQSVIRHLKFLTSANASARQWPTLGPCCTHIRSGGALLLKAALPRWGCLCDHRLKLPRNQVQRLHHLLKLGALLGVGRPATLDQLTYAWGRVLPRLRLQSWQSKSKGVGFGCGRAVPSWLWGARNPTSCVLFAPLHPTTPPPHLGLLPSRSPLRPCMLQSPSPTSPQAFPSPPVHLGLHPPRTPLKPLVLQPCPPSSAPLWVCPSTPYSPSAASSTHPTPAACAQGLPLLPPVVPPCPGRAVHPQTAGTR